MTSVLCITVGGKLNINVCKLVMLMDSDWYFSLCCRESVMHICTLCKNMGKLLGKCFICQV